MYMYYVKTKWSNAKHCGVYDSKFEAGYAQELELRKKAGDIKDFEAHVKMPLHGRNGDVVANYYVDFKIYNKDGTIEYVETKGRFSKVFKLKWKLFKSEYGEDPNVTLTIISQGKTWRPRVTKGKFV